MRQQFASDTIKGSIDIWGYAKVDPNKLAKLLAAALKGLEAAEMLKYTEEAFELLKLTFAAHRPINEEQLVYVDRRIDALLMKAIYGAPTPQPERKEVMPPARNRPKQPHVAQPPRDEEFLPYSSAAEYRGNPVAAEPSPSDDVRKEGWRIDPHCPVHIKDASNPKACTCQPYNSDDVDWVIERLRNWPTGIEGSLAQDLIPEAADLLARMRDERDRAYAGRAHQRTHALYQRDKRQEVEAERDSLRSQLTEAREALEACHDELVMEVQIHYEHLAETDPGARYEACWEAIKKARTALGGKA